MTTAAVSQAYQKTALKEPGPKQRIASIDILRGLVMLIMAIDHCRDFFHAGHPEPTDLAHTDWFLFFTRFITHFCAPTFVFLSGMSAYLAGTRRSQGQFMGFLVKRGLWLIAIELLVITLAITLNPLYNVFVLQVIWAIGGSMILLALVSWLPLPVIAVVGAILVLGHNIFDPQDMPVDIVNKTFAGKLLISGRGFGDFWALNAAHNRGLLLAYALLPWAGIMMIGYVFGSMYVKTYDAIKRRKTLLYSALGALAVFFVLRYFNIYGDPNPWSAQDTTTKTVISFFNVTKYPPSLLYTLVTLGGALLVLAFTEQVKGKFASVLYTYGSVPFFYYVCHWYTIRIFSVIVFFIQGYKTSQIIDPNLPILFLPNDMGFPLYGVYAVWFGVILLLYFPCKWYSNYKQTHAKWWLSYL